MWEAASGKVTFDNDAPRRGGKEVVLMRISLAVGIAATLLVGAGCTSDDNGRSSDAGDASTTAEPSVTTSTATASPTLDVDYPVPPGASGWPSRDLASCDDLGSVNEPELFVRVPVATPGCVTFSEANEVLVIATGKVEAGIGRPEAVDVPGFDGKIRSIMAPLSQGAVYLVVPTAAQANYLVVWDGGTDDPIERIITDLFATE